MLVLGLSGGGDPVYRSTLFHAHNFFHDSAAVIVDDGAVVAAIEEERLNRIKHTNKAAVSAIAFCLDQLGLRLSDLDKVVMGADEMFLSGMIRKADYARIYEDRYGDARSLLHGLF